MNPATSTMEELEPAFRGAGKLSIAFLVPHLGGGGAEINAVRLANTLAATHRRITLLVVRPGGAYEERVSSAVHLVSLGQRREVHSSTLAMAFCVPALRRWIVDERPDVVVAVMDFAALALVAAVQGLSVRPKLIVSVQNNPQAKARQDWINRLLISLTSWIYPKVDAVVALSRGVADVLVQRMPAVASRLHVVPNVGFDSDALQLASAPIADRRTEGRRLLVAVGRLVAQKDYPVLLKAVAALKQKVDVELWVLGIGPLEQHLRGEAERLGLVDRVKFLGFRSNPYAYMARADVFVLSSLWEGFGNVLVEAMAVGAAVVATDCPYGPSEIIVDGKTGRLVRPGDSGALALALEAVLVDETLRAQLASAGSARALDYDAQNLAARWAALFYALLGAK